MRTIRPPAQPHRGAPVFVGQPRRRAAVAAVSALAVMALIGWWGLVWLGLTTNTLGAAPSLPKGASTAARPIPIVADHIHYVANSSPWSAGPPGSAAVR